MVRRVIGVVHDVGLRPLTTHTVQYSQENIDTYAPMAQEVHRRAHGIRLQSAGALQILCALRGGFREFVSHG
jgi:hypothetical protein